MTFSTTLVFTSIYHIYLNIRQELFLLHHLTKGKSNITITHKVKHFMYSCLKTKDCEGLSSYIWMNIVFNEWSNGVRYFSYRLTVISKEQKYTFLNTLQHCRNFGTSHTPNHVQVPSYKSYSMAKGTLSAPLLSTRLSSYQNTWQILSYLSWWGNHDCLPVGADSVLMVSWKQVSLLNWTATREVTVT
jgi:hypothetical protein